MNFSSAEMESMTGHHGEPYRSQAPQPTNEEPMPFELTAEEMKVLKECSDEAIFKRAMPWGVVAGALGFIVSNKGILHHQKFGVMPTTLGLACVGYLMGKYSYSKVCLQRVLQVPDGNLSKMFNSTKQLPSEVLPNSQYYAEVETPKTQDTLWDTAIPSSDIGLASIGSFDTVPSDYYQTQSDDLTERGQTKNSISYDELRKQNRETFTNRYRIPSQQSIPAQQPQQRYSQQRRPEMQDTQPLDFGNQTKYGDKWE